MSKPGHSWDQGPGQANLKKHINFSASKFSPSYPVSHNAATKEALTFGNKKYFYTYNLNAVVMNSLKFKRTNPLKQIKIPTLSSSPSFQRSFFLRER